ncbi:MAG: NAD(P)H-dependent oxidoreductase [Rhodobacteraceae bacterium]|jgi:multimeric flavodoxin WrbA|nr:NAD(P)H-dependent oxidoreductase [Paracoccaceae bacterium]
MTKVVCILGSPREAGNSDLLAKRFCDAARVHGATTRTHALRDLRFQGYSPARSGEGPYGPDDDLGPVLSDVETADVVVLATPVYFCNITGLAKQALDRFFCFMKPDYLTNPDPSRLGREKTLVMIQVQGEGADRYDDLMEQYAPGLDKVGFARRDLLRACGVREPGEVMKQVALLEQSDRLARSLALCKER